MRDILIEIIRDSVNGCSRHWAEVIADGLLESGVVCMPCKIGDIVYQTDTNKTRLYESRITKIIYDTNGIAFDERAIGKTVFLTKEEAEKALEERKNK